MATVSFDILLRGESDDIAGASLEKLRPPPESIEFCWRWLSAKGVTCHKTDFGLACEASVDQFEELFGAQLLAQEGQPNVFKLLSEPVPPADIRDNVLQITLPQPPTFF